MKRRKRIHVHRRRQAGFQDTQSCRCDTVKTHWKELLTPIVLKLWGTALGAIQCEPSWCRRADSEPLWLGRFLEPDLVVALRRLAKEAVLIVYDGEDHHPGSWSLPNVVDDRNRILDRYDFHLRSAR